MTLTFDLRIWNFQNFVSGVDEKKDQIFKAVRILVFEIVAI